MTTTKHASGLWALGPVVAKSLDGRNMLLVRRDNGATAAVDLQWENLLPQLQVFRTLQGHARAITQAVPTFKGRERLFLGALEKLLDTGIFVPAEGFLDRLGPRDTLSGRSDPVTLVITTCDRPDCLDRLLTSLVDIRTQFGGEWLCEVFDDSRKDENQRQNQAVVDKAAQRIPVSYFGREEQKEFLNWVGSVVNDTDAVLPWLLSSSHADNWDLPTYGVPVNLAFLKFAGSRIVLVDDDTVAKAWVRSDISNRVRFGNRSDPTWVLPGFEAAAASSIKHAAADPVGAHIETLGSGLRALLSGSDSDGVMSSSCLEATSYMDVSRLGRDSRIRYTRNGVFGDPGTVSDLSVFMPGNPFLGKIAIDERKYQAFRDLPRCVFWGQRDHAILSSVKFQRATFAGVDLDPYMAPVLPTGRGEDSMIGAMLKFLYPRDFGFRFNFSLEHRPEQARPWAISPQALEHAPTAVEMATHHLNATQVPYDADPATKMQVFSDTALRVIARDGGREVFDRQIATYHEILSDHVAALNQALATTPKGCMSWKANVRSVVDHALQKLRAPLPDMDAEIKSRLQYVERYAKAIPVWNQAFEHSRERRRSAAQ